MRIARSAAAVILTLSAAGAAAQPTADDAGNRAVPLPAANQVSGEEAETRSALHCNAARDFCLRAWREADGGAWFLDMHDRVPTGANVAPTRRIALPVGDDPESETHQIWPHLIREASGALLIGVERYRRAGFSGGGAGATQLLLHRLASSTAEPVEVLNVQTGYSALIRACFSEADQRRGRGCHQELEFSATLTLAPNAAAGRPRLAFATAARVFPRGSLVEGWEYRRYRRADVVWERDAACSYRRSFAFDTTSGRYLPDRPLPDCSTYSLP